MLVEGLPEFDWTVVSLPDRHFYWRARGNGLTYAFSHAKQLLSSPYDLIVATSMVDLCSLRGFLPALSSIPTLVYFHENQFAYPMKQASNNIVNAQLTSIYTGLCADRILFNSQFNQDTFYAGAQALLRKMPDGVAKDVLSGPMVCSSVLPVPIHADEVGGADGWTDKSSKADARPVEVVWNHRWEYDKQPEVFFAAMQKLLESGVKFRLHVMGQSFREVPRCFAEAEKRFANEIDTWGHQPAECYYRVLRQADIVVSTAIHDFQGLSLLEAIYRQCVPVAPKRVAYPEYVPESQLYDAGEDEATALYSKLRETIESGAAEVPDVSGYLCDSLIDDYRKVIGDMVG